MKRRKAERRYTFLVVPEHGRGEVWQRSVSRRQLQGAAAGVGLAAVALVALTLAVRPPARSDEADALARENAELHQRLDGVDAKLAELRPLVDRVRAFDEQLRRLDSKGALPGTGDWDDEAWKARQDWISGVIGAHEEADDGALEDRVADLADDLGALDVDALAGRLDELHDVDTTRPQLWPVEGIITSPFGYRHSPYGDGAWRLHKGLDIAVPYGTPILATSDGLVVFSGWDSGHGNMVVLDHGQGVATRYCHASQLLVSEGDEVYAGDTLALVGSTGISTGPHLHYEIWIDGEAVDPLPYLPARE